MDGGGVNLNLVRVVLVAMALGIAGYILRPPLCWHLVEALGRSSSACPTCACDCSAQPLLLLPRELSNASTQIASSAIQRSEKKWIRVLPIFSRRKRC